MGDDVPNTPKVIDVVLKPGDPEWERADELVRSVLTALVVADEKEAHGIAARVTEELANDESHPALLCAYVYISGLFSVSLLECAREGLGDSSLEELLPAFIRAWNRSQHRL